MTTDELKIAFIKAQLNTLTEAVRARHKTRIHYLIKALQKNLAALQDEIEEQDRNESEVCYCSECILARYEIMHERRLEHEDAIKRLFNGY